jgi:hypothetical protein
MSLRVTMEVMEMNVWLSFRLFHLVSAEGLRFPGAQCHLCAVLGCRNRRLNHEAVLREYGACREINSENTLGLLTHRATEVRR